MRRLCLSSVQGRGSAGQASFDTLPAALLLSILLALPRLVDRVRCALVCKRWASLLQDSAFWAELRFDGANSEHLDDAVLLSLMRRAGGRLTLLDVSSPACQGILMEPRGGRPFLAAAAAEGLTARLQTLRTNSKNFFVGDAAAASSLLAACPALSSAGVAVDGNWRTASAAAGMLPLAEGSRLSLSLVRQRPGNIHPAAAAAGNDAGGAAQQQAAPPASVDGFAALAESVAGALAGRQIAQLEFRQPVRYYEQGGFFLFQQEQFLTFPAIKDTGEGGATSATGNTAAAAEQLGAALAHPSHGPLDIIATRCRLVGTQPFAQMCAALTAESRLETLMVIDGKDQWDESWRLAAGVGARALAKAVEEGRAARLQALLLRGCDLAADGGCARL